MNTLESIESLIEHLTEKIEVLLAERETMFEEIVCLRTSLEKRDEEAVRTAQQMQTALEAVGIDVLMLEQERSRIETKLQGLNDRLINLVKERYRG